MLRLRFSRSVAALAAAGGICLVASMFLAVAQNEGKGAAAEKPAEPAATAVATEWTETDTRLANQYIKLLESNPEYGNVLNLLWGLYEKRGQTGLLLDYFRQAATDQQGSIVVKTLFGHLLRKNEQLDEARETYSAVLEIDPDFFHALRGAAELSDQEKRSAKALALYNRLVERAAITTPDGAAFRMRQAALLKENGQGDEAAAVWNALLAAWPGNVALRSEIVSLLIEAGRGEDAVKALEGLAGAADPETRLVALKSLAQVHEFGGDFDRTAATLRQAMALLHFQHHEFASLFERLVRLHERFDKLPDLEGALESAAAQPNPPEQAVHLMAQFYKLTANPAKEEVWTEKLSALVPANQDYQLQLVDIRMRNDHYAAAAETLDRLIAGQAEAPLSLTLLRSRVALNLEGRDAAEAIIDAFLKKWPNLDTAAMQSVLAFAREHYLDGLVERLLGGDGAKMLAGAESEAAPMELARFFRERGRTKQAEKTLLDYVAEAEGSNVLKASRLAEVTAAFRELDLAASALKAIDEAIGLAPENLEYRIDQAEIFVDQKRIDDAVAAFESIWEKSPDLKSRTDIDQRIFSLMRGLTDDGEPPVAPKAPQTFPSTPIQTLEQYRAAAAAANANAIGRASDDPPPKRLVEYYNRIKADADKAPSLTTRYRAGWWAIKLQDIPEASHQLNTARAEAGEKPVIEVEKQLLAVAELYEQLPMQAKQLETLSRIDPENAAEYRQRRAEVRFSLGYEDEAIRELEALSKLPGASLNTLKTLASLYQKQGRADAQVAVWQEAYRRADLFEKRNIIKQLSTVLIDLGKHEEALKAQMDLIRRETDPIQKRKEFDAQLSVASRHFMLTWMAQQYQELAQQQPFDAFHPAALAKIHRAQGDYNAAFLSLKRAYYMSGQDRGLLDELGELAGLTKDLKAAIYYRRQMISMNEDDTSPETWESLVQMLERDLRVGEADQIRERLESKFTQDAEFLTKLSRAYQHSGRWADAERVLARLTALRPWDAASWLEYGLVLNERGRPDAALPAFEKAIEETAEAALPAKLSPGERLSLWPVVTADRPGQAVVQPGEEEERNQPVLLRTVTDYPFLETEAQKSIEDWLEKPRPEFNLTPAKPREIRLRAIEEAARLHGRQASARADWVRRWAALPEASPVEKLWAYRHAGAGPETVTLMREILNPLAAPLERFLFSVVAMRMREEEALFAWVNQSGAEAGRGAYLPLAFLANLRPEGTGSGGGVTADQAAAFATSLRPAPAVTTYLIEAMRDGRRGDLALAFGRVLAEKSPSENGELMLHLAHLCGELGLDAERVRWLRRGVDAVRPRLYQGLPYHYFQSVTELYSDLETAGEREALLRELRDRIELSPAAAESSKAENRALLGLLAGDGDTAIAALSELVSRQLDIGRPSQRPEGDTFPATENWGQLERVLHGFAARRPAAIRAAAFFSALDPGLTADPRNLDAVSQYEQYEIERVCWKIESLPPPERAREIGYLYARLRDPASRPQLARTLEARGLHREAVPLYLRWIGESPEEITPARNFFSACLKSHEFRPALTLIQAYLSGERRLPSGMAPDSLHRQHAEFLLMSGNIEALTARAMGTVAPGGQASGEAQSHAAYYQNALIRAHERFGNDEAMLRVLSHLRDAGRITKDERLLAAKAAQRRSDRAGAIEWLSGIALDGQHAIAEVDAIRELATLHAAGNPPDREALGALARASGDYQDSRVYRDVSEKLFAAGAETEGRGFLLLAARHPKTAPADRLTLLTSLVRLRLAAGDTIVEIEPDFRALMENLRPDALSLTAWFEIVSAHTPKGDAAWLAAMEPYLSRPNSRLAAAATVWWLKNDAGTAPDLKNLTTAERDAAIELFPLLGEAGISLSRGWLNQRQGNVSTLCEGDEVRQIRLFGKLGDRVRAAEVQARLIREAAVDGFQQSSSRRRSVRSFSERWPLAGALAEAGFEDLAAGLYAAYHNSIRRLTWEHNGFIESYTAFLTSRGEFARAEAVLLPALQKSIGTDPAFLVDLYKAAGRQDELPKSAARFDLSSGLQLRVEELSAAGGPDKPQP
jgi:predicted Zn-dependent protease